MNRALLGALLAGAAIRGPLFLALARGDPLADPRALLGDALHDHEWARALARGEDFFEGRPYWRPPLYPIALSLLYRAFGPDPRVAWAAQHALGLATIVLVHGISRRLFDARAAAVAAWLAALYAPFPFLEGKTLSAAPVAALSLLSLRSLLSLGRPRASAFGGGFAAGLAAGFHPVSLLASAALGAAVLFAREPARARLVRAGLFALGAAIPIAPITARNLAESGQFVLVSANGGANVYLANHPRASGTFRPPSAEWSSIFTQRGVALRAASRALGREANETEASAYLAREAVHFAISNPAAYGGLLLRKAAASLANFEFDPLYLVAVERQASSLLRLPFVPFAAILGLAVAGALLRLPRGAPARLAYAFLAAHLAAALLFFAYSRFRLPAVGVLCAFAGAGTLAQLESVRARGTRSLLALLLGAGAAVGSLFAGVDESAGDRARGFVNLGHAARAVGRAEEARAFYERSLAIEPRNAPARLGLARLAEAVGDEKEALASLVRALAASPHWIPARLALGELLARAEDPTIRDPDRARELLLGVLEEDAEQYEALYALGGLAYEQAKSVGRDDPQAAKALLLEGAGWFRRASEADPSRPDAWRGLAECLRPLGLEEEARDAMRRYEAAAREVEAGSPSPPSR